MSTGVASYKTTQFRSNSPQEMEYQLIVEVTRDLEQGRAAGGQAMINALFRNSQMWTAFASDCLDPANGLPRELRARIISLSIWCDRHSRDVRHGKADIEPLIEINRAIATGLRQAIQAAQPEAQPQPSHRPAQPTPEQARALAQVV